MKEKIVKIIKNIFKWVTSPVWFPWKILFVRKPDKKFKVVDKKTKVFRIVRSPITKPVKFIFFLIVMLIEVSIVYKVKNFVAAPFIRSSVQEYYTNEFVKDLDDEQREVLKAKYEEMFENIDGMSSGAKNNFYAILNSDAAKIVLSDVSPEVTEYILDKFNEDETTRDILEYNVKNMNSIIPEYVKEAMSGVECNTQTSSEPDGTVVVSGSCDDAITSSPIYAQVFALTSKTVDTNLLLDVASMIMKSVSDCEGCQSFGEYVTTKNVDDGLLLLEYIYEQR